MNADLNPLLVKEGFPAYDRILPEHIAPAVDEFLASMSRNSQQG
jgi:Zn-dependent oligopeptidase